MIVVTSVAPSSLNSMEAIKTWMKYGKVFSLNSHKEMPVQGYKNVAFYPTHRIMEWNGRPLASINAMFDLAIEQSEDLLLINSDIVIGTLPELRQDGITIMTRCDYSDGSTIEQGRLYEHGFDAFHIPNHLLTIFPPTIYCLGNCFFDYSIPFRYLSNNIPVYWPQGKHIFHKMHPFKWNYDEWLAMGLFFKWEFKLDAHLSPEVIAGNILRDIQNRTIK